MSKTKTTKTAPLKPREAGAFTKRIGNTNYRVRVYFSPTSEETARDKIMRLVKNEMAAHTGPPHEPSVSGSCGEMRNDGEIELSRLRGSERYKVHDDEAAGQ